MITRPGVGRQVLVVVNDIQASGRAEARGRAVREEDVIDGVEERWVDGGVGWLAPEDSAIGRLEVGHAMRLFAWVADVLGEELVAVGSGDVRMLVMIRQRVEVSTDDDGGLAVARFILGVLE